MNFFFLIQISQSEKKNKKYNHVQNNDLCQSCVYIFVRQSSIHTIYERDGELQRKREGKRKSEKEDPLKTLLVVS